MKNKKINHEKMTNYLKIAFDEPDISEYHIYYDSDNKLYHRVCFTHSNGWFRKPTKVYITMDTDGIIHNMEYINGKNN